MKCFPSVALLLSLPVVTGWSSQCNTLNANAENVDMFDKPCHTWNVNNPNCGTYDEETRLWSNKECRYDGKYPNGFRTAQLYAHNEPAFYLTVKRPSNSDANRMAQLLIETDTTGQEICVKSADYNPDDGQGGGVFEPLCEMDQLKNCFPFPSQGDLKLQIYCDSEAGCTEEISFKYKVMYSDTMDNKEIQESSAENSPEMWCMKAQSDVLHKAKMEFPSEMEGPVQEVATHHVMAKVNSAYGSSSRLSHMWCYTLIGLCTLAAFFAGTN